jgi:hypothetical protein
MVYGILMSAILTTFAQLGIRFFFPHHIIRIVAGFGNTLTDFVRISFGI